MKDLIAYLRKQFPSYAVAFYVITLAGWMEPRETLPYLLGFMVGEAVGYLLGVRDED